MSKKSIFRCKSKVLRAMTLFLAGVAAAQIFLTAASMSVSAISSSGTAASVAGYDTAASAYDIASASTALKRSGKITVIEHLSLPLLENAVTRTLKYTYPLSWTAGNGTTEVQNTAAPSVYPWEALEGGNCVEVKMNGESTEWHRAEQRFDGGLDLSGDSFIVLAVNIPYASTTDAEIEITLSSSSGETFTESAVIEDAGWNGIFLDITDFGEKQNCEKLTLGVRYTESLYLGEKNSFFVDYLAAASESALRTYRFLSDDFVSAAGTFAYDDSSLCCTLTTPTTAESGGNFKSSIETSSLTYNLMGEANALRLTFINTVGCTSVTCSYITDRDQSFDDASSYSCAITNTTGNSVVNCLIPIYSDYIYQLRFTFDSKSGGDIIICSLTTASAVFSPAETVGSVDSCRISENKREITVRGKIPSDIVAQHRGSKVCLFESDMSNYDITPQTLAYMTPVAQTNISVEYTLKKTYSDMSCLNKKYTVAIQTTSGLLMIGQSKFISNPKILATYDTTKTSSVMKGIVTESTEATLLGSGSTVVSVRLDRLLKSGDNSEKYAFNGQNYEFDKTEIEKLDSEINNRKTSDAEIYLRLSLELTEDEIYGERSYAANLLLHPNAALASRAEVRSYAFNTSDAKGINALTAAVRFLSSRYASSGTSSGICGFIVGGEVNNAYKSYFAGDMALDEFAQNCAAAVRTVYNGAQSVNSALKVYIQFGDEWYCGIPAESLFRYDSRELLLSIGRAIKNGGDFEWYPCFGTDTEYIASREKKTASLGYEVRKITPAFYPTLCNFMTGGDVTYNGGARPIMLLSENIRSFSADDEMRGVGNGEISAAEFVYAFYRASCSDCKTINKFILTPSFDIAQHGDMLRYIDTSSSLSYTEKYLAALDINAESWQQILGEDPSVFTSSMRNISEATVLTSVPSTIKGSVSLWKIDSDGNTDGWSAAENCQTVTSASALGRHDLLMAEFSPSSKSVRKALYNRFEYQRDFSNFPFISLEVDLLSVPSGVDCAELCVVLTSGSGFIFANTVIMTGEWNEIVIPIGAFEGVGAVDGIKIFVRGIDGQTDIGSSTLAISNFVGLSDRYDSGFLTNAVENERNQNSTRDSESRKKLLILVSLAVAVCAGCIEAVYVAVRVKRSHTLAAEKAKNEDLRLRFSKYPKRRQ